MHGNTATLKGYFTEYIAQGILAQSGSGVPEHLWSQISSTRRLIQPIAR